MKYVFILLAIAIASADATVSPCKKGGAGQTIVQTKVANKCLSIYCYNGWILSSVILQKRSNSTPAVNVNGAPPTSLTVNTLTTFDIKQNAVRFYCTSSNHSRVINFVSNNTDVVALSKGQGYLTTPLVFKGSNITLLPGHTGVLPGNISDAGSWNKPFFSASEAWETTPNQVNSLSGYACDDDGVLNPINTTSRYFEIWVQTDQDLPTCTSSPTGTPTSSKSNTLSATASPTQTAQLTKRILPSKPERGTWAWSTVMNIFTLALGIPSRVGLFGLNVLQLTQLVSIQECVPFPLKENARGGSWIIGFTVFEHRVPHNDSAILFSILLLTLFVFLAYTLIFLIVAAVCKSFKLAVRVTYYVSFLFALAQLVFIALGIYSWRNILYNDSYKPDDRGIGFGYVGLAFTYAFFVSALVTTILRIRLLTKKNCVERPTRFVELRWTNPKWADLLPTMLWKQRDIFRAKYGTLYSCFLPRQPFYFLMYWIWIFPLCLFGSILPTDCDIRLWLITAWTFVFLIVHLFLWNIFIGRLCNLISHVLLLFLFIFFLTTSIWATRTYRTDTSTPYLSYRYPNAKDSLAIWTHINLFVVHGLILLWILVGIITWFCELLAGRDVSTQPLFASVVTVHSNDVKEVTGNPLEMLANTPAKENVIQDKSVLQNEEPREQERVNYLIGPIHYQGMEYVPPNAYPLNAFRRTSPDLLMYGGRDQVRATAGI